ncbi:MAG TPA: DUF2961 domain-containing protein [Candidatus Hydrogenedentes bacterium]|nr:DUF2961 domain-containing protein [Candidatus Hydrogenedentota bacterium]HQH54083.1 DUF2961 domain-containing protein [Candidatus Hydrogenedentota bacterium]
MRRVPVLLILLGFSATVVAAPITTGTLLDEMTDMHRLTRFPDPAYKTVQFSSYDHRSAVPAGPRWFDNSDGFGREPIPNFESVLRAPEGDSPGEYLMCDVQGPGAIVRLWTARITGAIRMYLDDAVTPLYDGPAEEFFLHPYNAYLQGSGVTAEALENTFYQRNAAYAPIPFAKRCRLVWLGNHGDTHFYEIQVRTYQIGTEVVTFSPQDIASNAERIQRAAAVLADPDAHWAYQSTRQPVALSVTIPPADTKEALKLEGPGALENLVLKVDAANIALGLRQTVMHVVCDGFPWGQVESPVGDFFGAGPGVNPYQSIPFTVAPDGTMTCRYVMPFKESLVLLFENHGAQEVSVTGAALPMDYTWDEASSMHFRARWRVDHDLVASGREVMGVQDMPFLLGRGQGVYVGTAIMLLNPNPVPTSHGNWWGEGDEKIFVDDDVRPSIYGTGSEDYFNYAWSANDIFDFPYCGQPRNDGPANRGFVVNYRWHVLDSLPFSNSIAFYMELFSHERTEGFSYGRMAYHYARPGFIDDHLPLNNHALCIPTLPETWEPAARFGAEEFTFFACEDLITSRGRKKFETGGLWQGGQVLTWTPAKADEKLEMTVDIEKAGDYSLMLVCMLRPDGGAFRAELNGEALPFDGSDPVKLVAPHHVQSRAFGARMKGLKAGKQTLTFIAAEGGKPVGLDFVGFRPR